MLWRSSRPLVFALLSASLCSQTANRSDSEKPTFTSRVQDVLVDVVVTDRNGSPVTGLQKDDFEVYESAARSGTGEKQTISSFEEHSGAAKTIERPRSLPPNVYTNQPAVASAEYINVLLLDSLNTLPEHQMAVRQQMIEYLKKIDPGPRLAIFTLGSRLRIVEGFGSDPRQLIEALNHRNLEGKPPASTPISSGAGEATTQMVLDAMPNPHGSDDATQSLQSFLNEEKATEQVSRVSMTLEALRQLSEYLSGFPGRKNLIWFSESFPGSIFNSGDQFSQNPGIEGQLRETINLMARDQIAVYPVAALGRGTDRLSQASEFARAPAANDKPFSPRGPEGGNPHLDRDFTARVVNPGAADEIASDTGGKSYYGSDGLKQALADANGSGSHYYTLSYSPSDKGALGRYRRIAVKLRTGHSTLAYRRGYFEEGHRQPENGTAETAPDPLQRLLRRGMPDATQIVFDLRVIRTTAQPVTGESVAGDNSQLHDPVVRFSADFIVPLDRLDFEASEDGVHHGQLEVGLVAYDHNGKALNWLYRSIQASLKPEHYAAVQKNGASFHEEIDVPAGEHFLRAGILDLRTKKAGTVEIALNSVVTAEDKTSAKTMNKAAATESIRTSALPSPEALARASGPSDSAVGSGKDSASSADRTGGMSAAGADVSSSSGDPLPSDVAGYCSTLAGAGEHSSTLGRVCEFALSATDNLPDVICERKTERFWRTGDGFKQRDHADVVTAKVAYRGGHEFYDDLRTNGQPADAATIWVSGPWSSGEFASSLNTVFRPASKPEFRFVKEEKFHSIPALVFAFHVSAEHNKYYFLRSGDKVWFPDYHGKVWLDKGTGQLLKFEREIAENRDQPITRAKTATDYSMVALGDGTEMVLPTHADVITCAPTRLAPLNCAHNIVTFSNWQKFRAKSKVILNPN